MKINFRTKFKDKITFVKKKGLKQTLFNETKSSNPTTDFSFSPLKKSNKRCRTIPNDSIMLNRNDQFDTRFSMLYQENPQMKAKKMVRFSIEEKKDERKYIDQMLEKHKNILKMIDSKTKWKGKRLTISEFDEQEF